MSESQIKSWIFLATAIASKVKPTNFKGILIVADGINHSIPTENEIRNSLTWLINKDFISKENKKYCLTPKGILEYEFAIKEKDSKMNIWKNLEHVFLRTYKNEKGISRV